MKNEDNNNCVYALIQLSGHFPKTVSKISTYLQFIKGEVILEKVAKRKTGGLNLINLEERNLRIQMLNI